MYEINGVPMYYNLEDLRGYMCNSQAWHDAVLQESYILCDNADHRVHWHEGLYWLMGTHARLWELRGWSFEPNVDEIFQWLDI